MNRHAARCVVAPMDPQQRALTTRERRRIWDGATAYIDERYAERVELDDVARACHCSRRQVQRVFAEVGNTTLREHVCRVKMQAAARLLQEATPMTVRAVAEHVGYRQQAQFAKAFRRHHGVAPSQFRAAVPPARRAFSVAA